MSWIRRLLLAASCVTTLPVAHGARTVEEMSGLSKYLPAVGLLIGALLVVPVLLSRWLAAPPLVVGICVTLCWLLLTGAIHLDGWMDTADGIFSHRSRERMLEIMRDSRVGNFGVIAGLFVILIKFAALSSASYRTLLITVILTPSWARFCEVFAIAGFPYAREEGMGKVWHETTWLARDLPIAALVPLAASLLLALHYGWLPIFQLSACVLLSGVSAALRIADILRGHTGDTYGAVVELAEAGGLLICALLAPWWRF